MWDDPAMKRSSLSPILVLCSLVLPGAQGQSPIPPAPNSWSAGTPMPTQRQYPFTGAIGQNIYVVGGASSSSVLTVNEVYDTATNAWTTAAPMPTARWDGASAVVNNILYAIGGANANSELSVVEAYDPATVVHEVPDAERKR
jgi:hypothetical protein